MNYYAGIDLGGTNIKCGIVDGNGKLLAGKSVPTKKERGAEKIILDMAKLVKELNGKTGKKLEAVGVGCPGLIDGEGGMVVYSNNLEWKNVLLKEELQNELSLPVEITNDANAAALGEYFYGAGKKYKSMILLTLGTGVGSGIVLGGKLFEGNRGAGTELGHEVIRAGGEKCSCGRRGCLEAYASASALIRQTQKAMERNRSSMLWTLCGGEENSVTAKTAFEGMRSGDKTSMRVVKKYIGYLGEGITNIINAFHPEAIVLGGGICAEKEELVKRLKREVEGGIFGGAEFAPVEIAVASLGNDAGICGAAGLTLLRAEK